MQDSIQTETAGEMAVEAFETQVQTENSFQTHQSDTETAEKDTASSVESQIAATADAAAFASLNDAAAQFNLPVDKLVSLLMQSRQEFESVSQQDRHDKLAEEFMELSAEVPELTRFADVPEDVVTMALNKNIRLLDAFLRHDRVQRLSAEREAAAQTLAATQSAGPAGGLREDFDGTTLGFRRSFREALGM